VGDLKRSADCEVHVLPFVRGQKATKKLYYLDRPAANTSELTGS
jgi:hypothetical protein